MPVRKSFFWKAASASRRNAAAGLVTVPASLLICASSLIAASSSALCLKGFSAATAGANDKSQRTRRQGRRERREAWKETLLRQRIAATIISGPDGVERMAGRDANRLEHAAPIIEIDTTINRVGQYPQKST